MRPLGIAAFAIALSTGTTLAGGKDADAPISYHVPGVTVVIHKKSTAIDLKDYPKITWLDQQFTLQCLASNCLVTVIADAFASSIAQTLCTYIDGKPMKPTCQNNGEGEVVNLMQGQLISQGTHTFRTGIVNGFSSGNTVCPCSIKYTLYDSAS